MNVITTGPEPGGWIRNSQKRFGAYGAPIPPPCDMVPCGVVNVCRPLHGTEIGAGVGAGVGAAVGAGVGAGVGAEVGASVSDDWTDTTVTPAPRSVFGSAILACTAWDTAAPSTPGP